MAMDLRGFSLVGDKETKLLISDKTDIKRVGACDVHSYVAVWIPEIFLGSAFVTTELIPGGENLQYSKAW